MSESKEETIADIVAEMRTERDEYLSPHSTAPSYMAWRLDEYAKRIEAAAGLGIGIGQAQPGHQDRPSGGNEP